MPSLPDDARRDAPTPVVGMGSAQRTSAVWSLLSGTEGGRDATRANGKRFLNLFFGKECQGISSNERACAGGRTVELAV